MTIARKAPSKKRRTRRRPGIWHRRFLDVLAQSANITEAARAAKIARRAVYRARDADEGFRQAWDDALEEAVDALEGEAFQRARDSSDTLLIFLLKAHRAKYRFAENVHHAVEISLIGLLDEAQAAVAARYEVVDGGGEPAESGVDSEDDA